jgi:hypothetical protein
VFVKTIALDSNHAERRSLRTVNTGKERRPSARPNGQKLKAKAQDEPEPEEPPDPGPPPTRDEHERWSPTSNIPTSFRLVKCRHPRCKLHEEPMYYPEDDRNSPCYFDGRALDLSCMVGD